MRNVFSVLALFAILAITASGCAGPEEKLGRGIRNTCEIVRLSGLRTSMEQTTVWDSPAEGATTGVVKGIDLSLARTGVGIYEVITFPFPPYHPVATKYLSPLPTYPDNCKPGIPNDPLYDANHYIGYQTGVTFGFVPGNQFDPLGQ